MRHWLSLCCQIKMEKLKIVCWDLILKLSTIGSGMIPISLGPQLVESQIGLLDQFSILILAKQKLRSMREMPIICMEATPVLTKKYGKAFNRKKARPLKFD